MTSNTRYIFGKPFYKYWYFILSSSLCMVEYKYDKQKPAAPIITMLCIILVCPYLRYQQPHIYIYLYLYTCIQEKVLDKTTNNSKNVGKAIMGYWKPLSGYWIFDVFIIKIKYIYTMCYCYFRIYTQTHPNRYLYLPIYTVKCV